jgi:hypothetical protein
MTGGEKICTLCQHPLLTHRGYDTRSPPSSPAGVTTLRCHHALHTACLAKLFRHEQREGRQPRCPLCRYALLESQTDCVNLTWQSTHDAVLASFEVRRYASVTHAWRSVDTLACLHLKLVTRTLNLARFRGAPCFEFWAYVGRAEHGLHVHFHAVGCGCTFKSVNVGEWRDVQHAFEAQTVAFLHKVVLEEDSV